MFVAKGNLNKKWKCSEFRRSEEKNEWAQESMGFDIRCLVKGSELSFVIRWLLLELGLEIVCSLKMICAATPETWNVIELMWFAHDAIEHRTIRNNIDLVWQSFVSFFWCVCVCVFLSFFSISSSKHMFECVWKKIHSAIAPQFDRQISVYVRLSCHHNVNQTS